MLNDLRFGLRLLRKNPLPSAVAVLALALGIGANTLVFTLVNGLLLRPIAFAEPDRLVQVSEVEAATGRDTLRPRERSFAEWRRAGGSFEHLVAAQNMGMSLTGFDEPYNPLMRRVSEGYFEALGVEPALGRRFLPEESRPPAPRVVILDHAFWQQHLGGDPEILGRTLELEYEAYEVVGVMPAGYRNPLVNGEPVLWLPLALDQAALDDGRGRLTVLGRLADGVSLAEAQAELEAVAAELEDRYPESHQGWGVKVRHAHEALVESLRPPLLLLLGAVGLVLLIACGNVANLLLARAVGRRREIAVRLAMGASRRHLLRQLLAESLTLSFAGAGLGWLLAAWSLEPIVRLTPATFTSPLVDQVRLDGQVLLFTLGVALVTGIVFGLAPARQAFQVELDDRLSTGAARSVGDRGRHRLRALLVVAEVGLSMMLLVGAGLMLRSFLSLHALPLGFDPEGLLIVRTTARGPELGAPERFEGYYRQVLEGVAALPGVEAVGACSAPPFFNRFGSSVPLRLPSREDANPGSEPRALLRVVSAGFFEAFGTPMLAGRAFDSRDSASGEKVAVVSRAFARRHWGGASPVGERLEIVDEGGASYRVIGVAGDVRGIAAAPEPEPILYLHNAQVPTATMSLVVRARGEPLALLRPVERVIWDISRDVPVYNADTVAGMLHDADWQPRFLLVLLGGFAVLAAVLAASGIYALLSSVVAERRREIGVRLAVGASRGDVLRWALWGSLRPGLLGLAVGGLSALALSGTLRGLLYGVEADDPLTYAAIAVGVAAVVVLSSALPALRATRVDPVVALRAE